MHASDVTRSLLTLGALVAAASGCARPVAPTLAPHVFAWAVTLPASEAGSSDALDALLEGARRDGRPVLVDFYAAWCAACRLLDHGGLDAAFVQLAARRFVTVRIDMTSDDGGEDGSALARRFGAVGLPTLAFVASTGEVLASPRVLGTVEPSRLARLLGQIP